MKKDEMKEALDKLFNDVLNIEHTSKMFSGIRKDVTYWSLDGKKLTIPPWNEDCFIDEENWETFEDFEKYGEMFHTLLLKKEE